MKKIVFTGGEQLDVTSALLCLSLSKMTQEVHYIGDRGKDWASWNSQVRFGRHLPIPIATGKRRYFSWQNMVDVFVKVAFKILQSLFIMLQFVHKPLFQGWICICSPVIAALGIRYQSSSTVLTGLYKITYKFATRCTLLWDWRLVSLGRACWSRD